MESLARPLRVLLEESAWFVRDWRLRVLRVRTTGDLAGTVVKLLMAQECHADNRNLFLRFDDPAVGSGRGWPARIARLRQQLDDKGKGLASAGMRLAALPERVAGAPGTAAEFAALLLAATSAVPARLEGLTVVVAPVRVESEATAAWVQEIQAMVSAPALKAVRWVLVDIDGDTTAPIADRLGAEALACDVVVDEAAAQEDAAARIDALAAPAAAQGEAAAGALRRVLDPDAEPRPFAAVEPGWQSAGAMPDVQPPRRVGAPPPASDDALKAVGLSPAYVRGGAQALRAMILSASLAARREERGEAVAFQARAAELCGVMGMPLEQVVNLMVLASYLLAVPAPAEARKVYGRAVEVAGAHGLTLQQALAVMGLAMLDTVERNRLAAATHYIEAARLAETAGASALAIECWRMAGQLALGENAEAQAVECWKKAIALCEPLPPAVVRATSAAEVGRALAAVVRKRGQESQARSLEEQSHRWEHGLPAPDARSPGSARPDASTPQPTNETTP